MKWTDELRCGHCVSENARVFGSHGSNPVVTFILGTALCYMHASRLAQ